MMWKEEVTLSLQNVFFAKLFNKLKIANYDNHKVITSYIRKTIFN